MDRNKINKIHLEVTNLIPFTNDNAEGFTIQWDSDIGFGEYTIYRQIGCDDWIADSEMMDREQDKTFIKELLRLFIEKLQIR